MRLIPRLNLDSNMGVDLEFVTRFLLIWENESMSSIVIIFALIRCLGIRIVTNVELNTRGVLLVGN